MILVVLLELVVVVELGPAGQAGVARACMGHLLPVFGQHRKMHCHQHGQRTGKLLL